MTGHRSLAPTRRALFLRIVEDYVKNPHPVAWRLYFLESHFPPHKLDTALRWLISNGLTGAKFLNWFSAECHNSDLEMHRKLLEVVDNAPLERVIAGKNFKP